MSEIETRVARLVDEHFPWGEEGFGTAPRGGVTEYQRHVEGWLARRLDSHRHTALALIARMSPLLRSLEEGSRGRDGRRLLARIDTSNLVKSATSVLEKMAREWVELGKEQPPINFRNFGEEIKDLARFRIVANFLSDVGAITEALERPYTQLARQRGGAGAALFDEYALVRNGFEDSILLPPKRRTKGERCRKAVFHPRDGQYQYVHVEVQVQTLLQEAWDKKDHFLIYEPRRRGAEIPLEHDAEMFAMSELLYVADLTFDRLRATVLGQRGERGANT